MNKEEVIRKTVDYVRKNIHGDIGHDWWHVYRVWKNALYIAKKEKADLFVVQLAALLHDIADWKFHKGDDTLGPKLAKAWLENMNVKNGIISHVCEIIKDMSFRGAGVKSRMKTIEGMVVQDADRLDAIGAIGVARAFSYGGYKGRDIYNPQIKPKKHKTFEQYKSGEGPTINHFYEKLLLLKGRMNTRTGRKMTDERHKFMEQFLERFFKEWKSG